MKWILDRFSEAKDQNAFIHNGRQVTYQQVISLVSDFEKRLKNKNIRKGDVVVVLGDYSPEAFCFILALALNGIVVIPLTRESVIEESAALSISGCKWFAEFDQEDIEVDIREKDVVVENDMLSSFLDQGKPGLILFSSGSTGAPKAILHDFEAVAEKFRKKRKATVAIPFLMMDHFGGINTILAITTSLGTVVTVRDRSVQSICEAIETYKIQLLPATPSFLTMLVASNMHNKYNLSSLVRVTYGTEVMPQFTLTRLKDIFPDVVLQQTYGLSEVGVLRSQSRDDGSLWVRIGGEGFQTRVIDDILWIKSDYRMIGYLNAPSDFDEEGWFNTNDKVEVDGEYFKILGRTTDIINVGGQKVYPAEIEDVILSLDNIVDVAVYGEANALLGQIIVAKVILEGEEPLSEVKKRIRKACRNKLTLFKVPAKVVLVNEKLYTSRHKKTRYGN
jgi:acyl-coenzyme A synthetase/AMP-(fatty) acid ligase